MKEDNYSTMFTNLVETHPTKFEENPFSLSKELEKCTLLQADRWMDGWMNGKMDGETDGHQQMQSDRISSAD